MKPISKVLVAAALMVSPLFLTPSTAQALLNAGDVIAITGQGELKVDPDVVYLDMAVVARATTVAEAQRKDAAATQSVYAVLSGKFKLGEKDVRTTSYTISPEYKTDNNNNNPPVVIGYTVRNAIRVTLRDLKRVGELVDTTGAAGANEMNTITFATEKQKEYELQALKLAMKDARAKAETIADAEGRRVTRLVKVTSVDYRGVPVAQKAASRDIGAGTTISSGQLTVSVSVNVDYEF